MKLTSLLLILSCGFTLAHEEKEPLLSATVHAELQSEHNLYGIRLHQKPVIHTGVEVEYHPLGIYAGVESSSDTDHPFRGEVEWDYVLGVKRPVFGLHADLSIMYTSDLHLDEEHAGDFLRPRLKLTMEPISFGCRGTLTPFIHYEGFIPAHHMESPLEGGHLFGGGADLRIRLNRAISLVSTTALYYNDGFLGTEPGALLIESVGLEWKFKRFTWKCVEWRGFFKESTNHNLISTGIKIDF